MKQNNKLFLILNGNLIEELDICFFSFLPKAIFTQLDRVLGEKIT
jgi:hypothetical protein